MPSTAEGEYRLVVQPEAGMHSPSKVQRQSGGKVGGCWMTMKLMMMMMVVVLAMVFSGRWLSQYILIALTVKPKCAQHDTKKCVHLESAAQI